MKSEDWDHIERLFLRAADLAAAEQRKFLDEACQGDAELRAEVESLLRADSKNGAGIAAAVDTEAVLLLDAPACGEHLGPYRLLREIGRGGIGAVYLAARDDEQYQKHVAIKLVKRGMDSDQVLARFRYERQILANLDHPYIARLLDGGTTTEGRPFFVMEYIEGKPVNEYCRSEGLDVRARCRLFLNICEAVAYAHRSLVVHRDLKPGNILVTAQGTPKLLDFGLAKLLGADAQGGQTTVVLERPFTPEYASPEQVRGLPMTTATDVYSLGAVLYELLTGQKPHRIGSYTQPEVERAVCDTEVARPGSVARGVDADLDNIVLHAMRKEPDRRYPSVEQFAEDIRRHLDGRPVAARGDSYWYRMRKQIRRHRWEVGAGALVFASLLAATIVSEGQARRAAIESQRAGSESRRAEQRLSELLDLANRTLFDIHNAIAPLPGALAARRAIVKTTLDYLERLEQEGGADERIRRGLSDAYYRVGEIQGDIYGPSLEDFEGAGRSWKKAEALLTPLYRARSDDPGLMLRWLKIKRGQADLIDSTGQRDRATAAFESLLPVAHRLGEMRPWDEEAAKQEAEIDGRLANDLQYGQTDRALEFADRQIKRLEALIERFGGRNFPTADLKAELGSGLAVAASAATFRGDLEGAAGRYRQSIELREALLAAEPNNATLERNLMVAYGNYASILGMPWLPNLGRAGEARAACAKAVEMARRLASADPQDVTARIDLAAALSRLGSIQPRPGGESESLARLEEAIAISDPLVRANPKAASMAIHLVLARIYAGYRLEALGRGDEAEEQFRQSLAEAEPHAASGYSTMIVHALTAEEALAMLYASRGERQQARSFAQRALARAQKYLAAAAQDDSRTARLAQAYFVVGSVEAKFANWDVAGEPAQAAAANWRLVRNPGVRATHRQAIRDTDALLEQIRATHP